MTPSPSKELSILIVGISMTSLENDLHSGVLRLGHCPVQLVAGDCLWVRLLPLPADCVKNTTIRLRLVLKQTQHVQKQAESETK